MAIASSQVTVGTTATLLANATETDSSSGVRVKLNNIGTANIFVGPSGVPTATEDC